MVTNLSAIEGYMATNDLTGQLSKTAAIFGVGVFDFLTEPVKPRHRLIRIELMDTLLLSRSTVLFGAISLTILLLAIGALDDPWKAVFSGTAFAVAAALRLRTISDLQSTKLDRRSVAQILTSGLIYAAAISLVGVNAAISGDPVLSILGGLVMTGMVFGFCISNSGAPRYAMAQAIIVTVPFLLTAALSGPPAMLLILLQMPIWLLGLHGLIRTTHARLADLVDMQKRNHFLANNDSLTGLANRTQMMSILSQIADDRAKRSPPPYVMYLDLDGFKLVNDTHGHAMGDKLLHLVGQRLTEVVRQDDMVGRIGGDEFVIILRDIPPTDIQPLAERVIQAISKPFQLSSEVQVQIGVSIGGAPLQQNAEEALAAADGMLYAAKRNGRGSFQLTGF
jgi:diguanylate cyclase (GGDEF)-like protein